MAALDEELYEDLAYEEAEGDSDLYDEDLEMQACRYLVKDFGTSRSPKSTRQRDSHCAPAALRTCRFATPSQARRWLRSTTANGWTAFRM